ncbi:helix-hairpin-helix domain-containing protein [Paenibacillus aestuarii]|uniref:DNA-binding protein n=1 Tax=Paenibacillus aestuarii TaxID=516965 RepID=A0ABW0KEN4_9BACL|nr:DNA-binding protein [Paenibacillus aestuarii]
MSNAPNDHEPQISDLPAGLAKPALRALAGAGYLRLEQFSRLTEAEVLKLHGMGPKALELIRRSLAERGLSFAASERT